MDATKTQPGFARDRHRQCQQRRHLRKRMLGRRLRILAVPCMMALLVGAFTGSQGPGVSFAAGKNPAANPPVAVARPDAPQSNAPQPRPGRDAESHRRADPLILLTESGEQP